MYISIMKNRSSVTVDQDLMQQAESYAAKHQTSVSQLVEQYFKSLVRPAKKKNIIQLIDSLPKPAFNSKTNLREAYFEDQKKKHGF